MRKYIGRGLSGTGHFLSSMRLPPSHACMIHQMRLIVAVFNSICALDSTAPLHVRPSKVLVGFHFRASIYARTIICTVRLIILQLFEFFFLLEIFVFRRIGSWEFYTNIQLPLIHSKCR
jgi:hypothetical protein